MIKTNQSSFLPLNSHGLEDQIITEQGEHTPDAFDRSSLSTSEQQAAELSRIEAVFKNARPLSFLDDRQQTYIEDYENIDLTLADLIDFKALSREAAARPRDKTKVPVEEALHVKYVHILKAARQHYSLHTFAQHYNLDNYFSGSPVHRYTNLNLQRIPGLLSGILDAEPAPRMDFDLHHNDEGDDDIDDFI